MPCPQCGRVAADDDRFCGGCGTELVYACRHCGRRFGSATAFCTGCGRPRAEPAPASTPTEDRRRVSVLFIDLIDFTPYAERADPELVRTMQNRFYAAARRVVGQYGGVVEKYIGDAVMALFGAPVATEADAVRCVRAGLELQRALAGFDADPVGSDAPDPTGDLRFRVGVATGEALVDVAAARDGGQAIVAGDVVNTASRLQSVAPPGGVIVCGRTHALTANAIRYAERPPVTLRGRSNPTEVWLAIAPVQRRHTDTDPDPTPLVERQHELGLLINALHRAVRDRIPQLVTVFGQAGIGKSRLVRELYRHAERLDEPVVWRTGHCPPFGENVTYAGLADIVKAEAGILDTGPAATAHERLARAARRELDTTEAERLADALGPLVGLPGARLPAEEAESAWRRFLIAMASRRPTVLVFEDLHWADEPMLRFIELLAAGARDAPLLVLCTARPELIDRDASWAGTITGSLTITLPPLRPAGVAVLYRHMLGQLAFSSDLLSPLIELADGNPLYAQEYVRMLIERGAVRQSTMGWSLDGDRDLPMPDSVQAVIANRVDLLDARDRGVLQAAAVVGMQFWPGAVAAALGRPTESVERSLRRLEQRDFIAEQFESTMAGQSEFRFRHVLVRDVCYQRLPRTERVARHERTAAWLDGLPRGRDNDLAEVLAHHRWTTHEIARSLGVTAGRYAPAAREALHRAARRAYALHALDAAAGHVGRALTLVDSGDDTPESTVERLRLELLATEVAFYRDQADFLAGDGTDRLHTLAERLAARAAADAAARAFTLLGQAAWLRADRTAALQLLGKAVALFDSLPDSAEKVDAFAELGRLHMLNYEQEPALAVAGVAADMAERLGLVEARTQARITVATARYQAGDPAALADLREITQFCRERQLLAFRRSAQNLGSLLIEEGEWARALDLAKESRESDVPGGHSIATGYSDQAIRAYFTGDFDACATAADAFADTPGGRWDLQVRGLRSCLRVLRAETQVPDDVPDALEIARDSGFHRPLWTALAMAALCRALQHRRSEAADLLAELTAAWQKVQVIASGEWVGAAAFAAALAGPEPAEVLRAPLAELPRRTRWAEAALATVNAATVGAGGDHVAAGAGYLAAADVYAGIPAVTDRMLALALAADAFQRAGAADRSAPARAEVRAFARRNGAPGLLGLAGDGGGGG